jgi:putative ABC transport system permease protein
VEIRPIISALMRSKVALVLIGLQIALTLAIVCNALFIINQRIETMSRPSGMNETNTFMIGSNGFGTGFNTKNAFVEDLALIRSLPGVRDATPMNSLPMTDGGWSEGVNMQAGQKVPTTMTAIYFMDDHGIDTFGTKLIAGRTLIHVFGAQQPDPSFDPVTTSLEDVYFSTLHNTNNSEEKAA